MSFNNLIGNEKVKKQLLRISQSKKIPHSYLFLGPSGIGKTLFAKEFARILLCIDENKPCGRCKSCIQFESENQVDFTLIEPEESSKIKIEQIRSMQKKLLEKPIISDKKVYIIKDADSMTKEAQNCLLKTLEEPPNFVIIILVGSNESMFLSTIKSRCIKIQFEKIDNEELKTYLQSEHGIFNISDSLLKAFNGDIEKALRISKDKDLYEEIQKIFSNIENYSLLDVIEKVSFLYQNKENINDILDFITILFYEKALKNSKYISYIEKIEEVKRNLKANSNYDMSIDALLYKIWEE